jgi:hypothetical protein
VPSNDFDEYKSVSKNRNKAIVRAYKSGGYSLKEVGLFLDYIMQRLVELLVMQKARPDPDFPC